jgi:hypothetical protein
VASRAEPGRPAALGLTVRLALDDLYHHALRLVAANLIWGACLLVWVALVAATPLALLAAPLLGIPTAGLFILAGRVVRGGTVSVGDAIRPWREAHLARRAILLAALVAYPAIVLGTNVLGGLSVGSPLGWAMATLAGWGLIATWVVAWVAWPVVFRPDADAEPLTERLRLAVVVAARQPGMTGATAAFLALVVVVGLMLVVALLTVAMSFAALTATRRVSP